MNILLLVLDLLITVLWGAGRCLFVDAEHALDLQFAEGIGVRIKEVLFQQPDEAEQALDTVDHFVRSGVVDVIVVDSVCPGTTGPPVQFTFYGLYLLLKYCLQLSFLTFFIFVHLYVDYDICFYYILNLGWLNFSSSTDFLGAGYITGCCTRAESRIRGRNG